LNAYLDEYVQNLKTAIKDVREKIEQIGVGKETAMAVDAIGVEIKNNLAPQIIDLLGELIPIDQVKELQIMDADFQKKFDDVLSSASDLASVSGKLEEIVSEMEEKVSKLDKPTQAGKRKSK
jgi:hypothetical protein